MSSAETPNNNKRISLSNSFSDDQGYHGSGAEHEGMQCFITLISNYDTGFYFLRALLLVDVILCNLSKR